MSPVNGSSMLKRFERSNASEICNGKMFDFYPGLLHILILSCYLGIQHTHCKAGNFEGKNFCNLMNNMIFVEKTFVDCSLLQRQGATPPNFAEKIFANNHKTVKFTLLNVFLPHSQWQKTTQ